MSAFIEYCLSFPVIIFSGLLIVAVLYWASAALGLFDFDTLDIDIDVGGDLGDIGGDIGDVGGDIGDAGGDVGDVGEGLPVSSGVSSSVSSSNGIAGAVLLKLGLYGVPLTLTLTLIILIGWVVSYYGTYLGLSIFAPGIIRSALGVGLAGLAVGVGVFLTRFIIKPLRPFFKKEVHLTGRRLRGHNVIIRSSKVTKTFGEARYNSDGAGLLLKICSTKEPNDLKRGLTAVIIDYRPETNTYIVVSEDEFKGR